MQISVDGKDKKKYQEFLSVFWDSQNAEKDVQWFWNNTSSYRYTSYGCFWINGMIMYSYTCVKTEMLARVSLLWFQTKPLDVTVIQTLV